MFRNKVSAGQLAAWSFSAAVPVLIQLLGGGSWIWVAAGAVVSLWLTVRVWQSGWSPIAWIRPFLFIYVVLLLGTLLGQSAESWPTGSREVLPYLLLLLGIWSARKGQSVAARVGAVLYWAVVILYLVVIGAGLKDLRLQWLYPQWTGDLRLGYAVFLVPPMSAYLLKGRSAEKRKWMLAGLVVVVAAVVTAGVLSPNLAENTLNAFYEMSRGIQVLGVARRLEALISAGMTVGWFSLISLLLVLCGAIAEDIFGGSGKWGVWGGAAGAAAMLLCGLHIPAWMLLSVGTVFWVVTPLLTQGLESEKKS